MTKTSKEGDVDKKTVIIDEESLETPLIVRAHVTNRRRQNGGGSCCGCCLKVCGIIFLVLVGLTVLAGVGMYYSIRQLVQKITVTEPVHFPVVDMTPQEAEVVKDQAKLFFDSIVAGNPPEKDWIVTQDQLNGMLAQSDYLRGNAMVTLHKNEIVNSFSLPMNFLPGGAHRYLVADEVIDIKEEDGHVSLALDVPLEVKHGDDSTLILAVFHYVANDRDFDHLQAYLTSLKWLGRSVAEDYIVQRHDLLRDLYNDPKSRRVAEGIERIAIENGSIVVTPRRREGHNSKPSSVKPLPPVTATTTTLAKSSLLRTPKREEP